MSLYGIATTHNHKHARKIIPVTYLFHFKSHYIKFSQYIEINVTKIMLTQRPALVAM